MAELFQHLVFQLAALAPDAQGLAVALSGGADSWALTLLAHDHAVAHKLNFIALTVDHGLRAESAAEAATVAAACASRGIPHAMLVWQHDGIATRKQERARAARYELLGDYCAAHGFDILLTAHHADDQAETVLLRFAKGSGAKGLSGMRASRALSEKVMLLRPLLSVSKADLVAYAAAAGVPVTEDPSNTDPHYARARLRAALCVLEAEGLTTATLLKVAAAAQAEDTALEYAARRLLLDHAAFSPYGGVRLPQAAFTDAPAMLRRYAWLSIWRHVTRSAGHAPAPDKIDSACDKLAGLRPVRRTLAGMLQTGSEGTLTFVRETGGQAILPCNVPPRSRASYDNRYEIVNNSEYAVTILPTHGGPSHRQAAPWISDVTCDEIDWHGRPAALWGGTPDDPQASGPILPLRLVAHGTQPTDGAAVYASLLPQIRDIVS